MELLNQLAQNGLLALLLAISITANYLMFKIILNLYERQLQEKTDILTTTTDTLKGIKSTTDVTLTVVQGLLGRSNDSSKA